MAMPDRAADRATEIVTRMSVEEKQRIKDVAATRGLSVQQYMEMLLFGEPKPARRAGAKSRRQREQLPMSA